MEHSFIINFFGEKIEASRDNTSLFTFLGRAAFNHVFVITDQEVGEGIYIFPFHEGFDEIAERLQAQRYPQHLNMVDVPDCDRIAYEKSVQEELYDLDQTDTFPANWA